MTHPEVIRERAQRDAMDEAADEVLADMDSFCEWLYGQCYQTQAQSISVQTARHGDPLELTTPQLLAQALQWPSLAQHALAELRDRYVRDQADRIAALAADKVPSIEEDLRTPEEVE